MNVVLRTLRRGDADLCCGGATLFVQSLTQFLQFTVQGRALLLNLCPCCSLSVHFLLCLFKANLPTETYIRKHDKLTGISSQTATLECVRIVDVTVVASKLPNSAADPSLKIGSVKSSALPGDP